MSYFSYNGIELPFVRTMSLDQQAVYDPSNTDQLYNKLTLNLRFFFTTLPSSATVGTRLPMLPGESPGDAMRRIRHELLVPRRNLVYRIGTGKPLVECRADGNGLALDAKNGPHPLYCRVSEVGGESFYVDYALETHQVECDKNKLPYLSFRYSQSHVIDVRRFSTVRTNGKLIVRSDLRQSPDALRAVVAPPLLPGFERSESDYLLTPDGLELDFGFIDRELYNLPPFPAMKHGGKFLETTMNGALKYGTINYWLEGDKDTPKGDLVLLAFEVASSRLLAARPKKLANGLVHIKSATVSENLADNHVEVQMTAMLDPTPDTPPLGKRYFGVHVIAESFDDSINRFPNSAGRDQPLKGGRRRNPDTEGIDPGLRGNIEFLELVASAFNDPCLQRSIGGSATLKAGSPREGNAPYPLERDQSATGTGVLSTIRPVTESSFRIALNNQQVAPSLYKDTDPGQYDHHDTDISYVTDPHVSAPPPTMAGWERTPIQFSEKTIDIIVRWSAEKIGGFPRIPPEESKDPNLFLLGSVVNHGQVELGADGRTKIYSITGEYRYGARYVAKVDKTSPVPPWLDVKVDKTDFPTDDEIWDVSSGSTTISGQQPGV
jgi:hypothetical protein